MKRAERSLRAEIVARCREMNASGINQGTSGNISARFEDRMLISPSATPYDDMTPETVASLALEDEGGSWEGPLKPSTEWRMHRQLLLKLDGAAAVIHAHPTYCTALAMARKDIPACHYMVAAFGGNSVRCAGYDTFGTAGLARLASRAMKDRTACLLANHGMIAVGDSLAKAMWRAVELETIARQYYLSLLIGGPVLLESRSIKATLRGFDSYGVQPKKDAGTTRARKAAPRKGR